MITFKLLIISGGSPAGYRTVSCMSGSYPGSLTDGRLDASELSDEPLNEYLIFHSHTYDAFSLYTTVTDLILCVSESLTTTTHVECSDFLPLLFLPVTYLVQNLNINIIINNIDVSKK